MKVGAEPKKVAALVLLLGLAGVLFYQQFVSDPVTPSAAPPTRSSPPARQLRVAADDLPDSRTAPRPKSGQSSTSDFKPSLKRAKPGEGPSPVEIDPTLRTDLLAKVQAVDYHGVERNLFQFGAPKPKAAPPAEPSAPPPPPKSEAVANGPPPEPDKPAAPPINMRYFGYANRPGDARKRAFILDGEEIYVAVEGEVIKKRYRVVRIGINSLVVEDMDFKSQQTLPLQEESS